jgi:hypothetical protein
MVERKTGLLPVEHLRIHSQPKEDAMITKKQRANAERIVTLSNELGHLPFNKQGQTPTGTFNLSIPCAVLVVAGIVTGVADTGDGINDDAVRDVERICRDAVEYATEQHGTGWWNEKAEALKLA